MRQVRIGFFATRMLVALLLRGLLLWVLVPLSFVVYLLSAPILLLVQGASSRRGPRFFARYGVQMLDATFCRAFFLQEAEAVPWPWQDDADPPPFSALDFL